MNEIIDIPAQKNWTERLMDLPIDGSFTASFKHYRTVTSRFSSREFKFKFPGASFKSSVNEDGQTFTVTRTA